MVVMAHTTVAVGGCRGCGGDNNYQSPTSNLAVMAATTTPILVKTVAAITSNLMIAAATFTTTSNLTAVAITTTTSQLEAGDTTTPILSEVLSFCEGYNVRVLVGRALWEAVILSINKNYAIVKSSSGAKETVAVEYIQSMFDNGKRIKKNLIITMIYPIQQNRRKGSGEKWKKM